MEVDDVDEVGDDISVSLRRMRTCSYTHAARSTSRCSDPLTVGPSFHFTVFRLYTSNARQRARDRLRGDIDRSGGREVSCHPHFRFWVDAHSVIKSTNTQ